MDANFDSLINDLVLETQKYYKHSHNKTPFSDNFKEDMIKEWNNKEVELKKAIKYYKYLNQQKSC